LEDWGLIAAVATTWLALTAIHWYGNFQFYRSILILLDRNDEVENEELWVATVDRFKRREQLAKAAKKQKK
tara:strand:- start:700 stop:912 length:213 start_codon:yes stop_codon:yes gene_type:complete